jgi:hypothetical protein
MQPLRELQREFSQALRYAQAPLPAVRTGRLSASQRLQVYRNNSRNALVAAIRSVYPATERLVGEEFFMAAAHEYLDGNPSHSGNIQDYGGAFAEFLRGFAPAASVPYLADVSSLEWKRVQTALAPAHTPMDLAALSKVPTELQPELHFMHQPAARAMCSEYPVLSIWEFCQVSGDAGGLDISGGGECALLARPQLDVYMRRLTIGEYRFLQALCHGEDFTAACTEALQAEPAFDVERTFAALVQEEILTGFYL